MMIRKFPKALIYSLCVFIGLGAVIIPLLSSHAVDLSISDDDKTYIQKAYDSINFQDRAPTQTFEGEIERIEAIQKAAFAITPNQDAIPMSRPREPKDLFELRTANCSDRSRFLHKAYRLAGFDVRYASVFATPDGKNPVLTVLTPHNKKVRSHALIEVQTSKGWMFVDTVEPWIALSKAGQPLSLESWQNTKNKADFEWTPQDRAQIYHILNNDFTYLFGLYSRHGRFYPPYNMIPDVNWSEILENFKQE